MLSMMAALQLLLVPPTDTLLVRLTAEAIAANPSLAAQRASARAAQLRVRPAGALPDPELGLGVIDLVLPTFAFRESDFTEVDVGIEQSFPWPGTLGARTRSAIARAEASSAEERSRQRDVITRTAALYYRLRYVAAVRIVLERQRALLATGVEVATARYATGLVPQSDPLQARVARARLATETVALRAEDATLRAQLRAMRNAPQPDSIAIEPIRPDSVHQFSRLPNALHAVHAGDPAVLLENPRLIARRAVVEEASQNIRAEQLGGRPEFTVGARYGGRPLGSDFFSTMAGIRLPMWAGRKQHHLVDAARADAVAAQALLQGEQVALEAELAGTEADAGAGAERLDLLVTEVIPAAEAMVEAVLRSYRAGHVDFLNVLAAHDALYRATIDAAAVAAEYLTHLMMLEQLLAREDAP
jgi:outer membrane protein TolC